MVKFCTQFIEPIFYPQAKQQLAVCIDGVSIDAENQILTIHSDCLDVNKNFISNVRALPLYISDRLGNIFTPTGIFYLGIDINLPNNAKYLRIYVKNQYEQEVCSIVYKVKRLCINKENVAICWYNDLAGFDTFVFDGALNIDTNIKTVSSHFDYASRNRAIDKKTYDTTFVLSSKEVTEKQIKGIESLLISQEVYLFDASGAYQDYKRVINDELIPCVIDANTLNIYEKQKGIYEVKLNCKILEAYA
jgi:hypothetical protein